MGLLKKSLMLAACIAVLVFFYGFGPKPQPKTHIKQADTVYMRIANFKDSGNFDYQLVFRSMGKRHVVYTRNAEGTEFNFLYDFKTPALYYKCFEFFGAAGAMNNILWNRKDNSFYATENYNFTNGDDELIKDKVDFQKRRALVRNTFPADSIKTYSIKLTKIWPKAKPAGKKKK
jgi:hypothetical protein